ncbi:hypothetical protein ACR9E3_21610 [Actinomycetospora sp. C-140]
MARERARPRWQLTTRSRFALVLGVAGLAVAGVQIAMLSDPPTVVQLVIVAFWTLVGLLYLFSAAAQHLRGRRAPAAPAPLPAPVEEIVPVPVRPARPRPRAGAVAQEHGAHDREAARPADRAARTEVVPGEPVRVAIRARRPARPAPATATSAPAAGPASAAGPAPAAVTAASAPAVAPAPAPVADATTDAFTVRASGAVSSPLTPTAGREPATARPVLRAVSGDPGLASALSFGPARGRTAAGGSDVTSRKRPRPTPPYGQPRVAGGPVRPDPLSDPLPDPLSGPLPDRIPVPSASPVSGPLPVTPRAPEGAVPAPRAPRHRAAVEDPVAARRGEPRSTGRHGASDGR